MTVTVWRVEHKCDHPHGPHGDFRCGDFDNTPLYGSCLETPASDPKLEYVKFGHEFIFGTLEWQFDRWWSPYEWDSYDYSKPVYRKVLEGNWYATKYEVEDDACYIGTNQVIFDSYRAVEVYRTQTDFPLDMQVPVG